VIADLAAPDATPYHAVRLHAETPMAKEKITETELAKLLMTEVGKIPECEDVISVAIIRPLGQNWEAAWKTEGNEIICRRAFQIARELQEKFDVAP
jgi:hypothetical protein